jgi:hypothetical protein
MKITLLTSLICCLCAISISTHTQAGDNPERPLEDRVKIHIKRAISYNIAGPEHKAAGNYEPPVIQLSQSSPSSPGQQLSMTSYDIQHHCSMGRQIEHRNTNYLHFSWTDKIDDILGGDRGIKYQAYDLSAEYFLFSAPGIRINNDRAGFVSLDADNPCAVLSGHEFIVAEDWPLTYWNDLGNAITSTFQSGGPLDVYSMPDSLYPNLWPIIEWDNDGTESVTHMVTTESSESGEKRTITYYRRTGDYGVGRIWSTQQIIDTIMNNSVTIASSRISDKVAIVWNAPADYKRDTENEFDNQFENDVWYAISTDAGLDWIAVTGTSIGKAIEDGLIEGGNITTYPSCGNYKAYCDISALLSETTDNLHIVWGSRRWDCEMEIYRRRSSIFHWSEGTDTISTVVKAEWDTGGTCYGYSFGSDAAKMSISECDGKFYVLYTQFGSTCDPCYDHASENNVMNGELFLTASGDSGRNWDQPQNLTGTETPGCTQGDCESEYWASMPRYGRYSTIGDYAESWVLDILYINDRSPGGSVYTESGVWTINPVMWMETPCRDVVAQPASFYFVHISDTHVGSPVYHYGAKGRLEKAINAINTFDPLPAFVVVSGDLAAWGSGGGGEENFVDFNDAMSGLNPAVQYYTCPGNHDARWGQEAIDNYKNKINTELNYREDMPSLGVRLISMFSGADESVWHFYPIFCIWGFCIYFPGNFDIKPEGEGLSSSQYDQLHTWLNEEPTLKKIVFMHHPIVWCSKESCFGNKENECGNACIWSNREETWDLLRDPNGDEDYDDAARVVLSGHTHKDNYQYRSDDPHDSYRIPTANWINTVCDTGSGLLPLHANTGALTEDLSYRVIAFEHPDVKISRTYYFDRTATSSAFWINTQDQGEKESQHPEAIQPGRQEESMCGM